MIAGKRITGEGVARFAPTGAALLLLVFATVAFVAQLAFSPDQSYAVPDDAVAGGDGLAAASGVGPSAAGALMTAQAATPVTTEDDLRTAIQAGQGGGTVEIDLGADITLTGNQTLSIPANSKVTITSTGGHTLTASNTVAQVFFMQQNSSLNLGEGLTVEGSGVPFVLNNQGGSFVLDGATLTKGGSGPNGANYCVRVLGEGSTFEFKKGTIKDSSLMGGGIVNVSNKASMVMSGGRISGCQYGDASYKRTGTTAAVYVSGSATFEMTGGEISGNTALAGAFATSAHGVYVNNATFIMGGGAITGNGPNTDAELWDGSDASGGITANGAKVVISGGEVSDNRGFWGGGAFFYNSTALITGTAKVSGNRAYCGGGVYVRQGNAGNSSLTMDGGQVSNNYSDSFGGGLYVANGSTFNMNDGEISGNEGDSGGGLYVAATEKVTLTGGRIQGNRAKKHSSSLMIDNYGYGTGGGITVANTSSGITMRDVLVTENTAGTIGGGAWLCPTGDVQSQISDGVAMYDNKAAHAADDLAVVSTGSTHDADVIQGRILGGGVAERYVDGSVELTDHDVSYGDGSGQRYSAGRRELFDYASWDKMSSIALHNEVSANAKELAEQRARLVITGNTADTSGGGIASNGHVRVGKAESKKVVVRKVWGLPDGESALSEVRVKLEIDGAEDGRAREVEEVVLNASNNWTHTFEGIPVKARVNLEEAEVTAPGWVSYYKESFSGKKTIADPDSDEPGTEQATYYELETVDVSNAREGKLTIAKEIDGNLADPDQEFQFQVTILNPDDLLDTPIVDEQSEEETLYRPYEGRDAQHHARLLDFDYSGSRSGTLVGGTGTITLKGGESVTVEGLPHGAWYRVSEVASTADGYEIMPKRNDGAVGHVAETGTIVGDATTSLNYTNLKGDRMGSLKVSKAVGGNAADPDQLFHFQVRFFHSDGSELTEGEFAYVNSHEGVIGSGGMFALKGGESIHIDGIPADTRWTVKEVVADAHGYEVEPVCGDMRGEDAEEGVIESRKTTELAYTNVKDATMGTLAVSKRVASGDASREFEFQVTFTDESGNDVRYGEFAYTGDREGFIESGDTLKLSSGERVVIEGLPAGTSYEVREVNAEGYEATYEGAEGTIASGGAAEAKVVNNLPGNSGRTRPAAGSPRTGDSTGTVAALVIGVCLLSALAAGSAWTLRRRDR